jgi:hypothetical protein
MLRLADVLLLVSFVGFGAHAAMELPPELHTESEFSTWKQHVIGLVPEIATSTSHPLSSNIEGYISKEQALVKMLRENHRYMAEAESRPPLQTFKIIRGATDQVRGPVAGPRWASELQAVGYQRAFNQQRPYFRKAILDSLADAQKTFSVKIFAGLSRLLTPEERALLSEPNPISKWAAIAEILFRKDMQWIRANFDATLFGLTRPDWRLEDLGTLISETSVPRERNLAVNIERLYSRANHAWFIEEDLAPELKELVGNDPKLIKFLRELKKNLAKRFAVHDGIVRQAFVNRELVLRELPPYLAIYRGCVGNDCSTTHSYAFPYSPFERNWWIEDTEGKHLGYVSGNITLVDGKPTLYIRDVTGPGLLNNDITMILNGFYLAKKNFGAAKMTLADASFSPQNHFPFQQVELVGYTDLDCKMVDQDFQDFWIRNILTSSIGITAQYDSVNTHIAARLIERTPGELDGFRIETLEGEPTEQESILLNPERVWSAVSTAVQANSVGLLAAVFGDKKVDLHEFLSLLRNDDQVTVREFYENVKNAFSLQDLPYSQNLAKKFESLFLIGHLNSTDAFTAEENIRRSVRFVTDLFWRSGNPELALPYFKEHIAIFQKSEILRRAVKSLFDRWQNDDVQKVQYLDSVGYSFEGFDLELNKLTLLAHVTFGMNRMWAVEQVLARATSDAERYHAIVPIAQALNNVNFSTDEQIKLVEKAMSLLDGLGDFVGRNPTWGWKPTLDTLQTLMIHPEIRSKRISVDITIIYLRNGGGLNTGWALDHLRSKLSEATYFKDAAHQREARQLVESCESALAKAS